MKNKWLFILLALLLIGFLYANKFHHQSNDVIPKEVKKYLEEKLPGYKFVSKKDLSPEILEWTQDTAKVWLNEDYTGEGDKDFIVMIGNKEGRYYLAGFLNYQKNLRFVQIEGVAYYGKNGIGNFLYSSHDNNCFYNVKFESSLAKICWDGKNFKIKYIGD